MRLFVNGAAGFVGRHLMQRLPPGSTFGVDVVECDLMHVRRVCDKTSFRAAVKDFAPDVMVHLAAYSATDATMEHCLANIEATMQVLEAAKQYNVRSVILAGSAQEYGRAPTPVLHRETDPLTPSNLYAASKAAQTMLASSYGVPAVILRFANIYGAGQVNKFIPNTIKKLASGQKMQVTTEQKSWLHIDDCCAAIIAATVFDQPGCHVFNICGASMASAATIAALIGDYLGKDVRDLLELRAIDDYPPWMDGTLAATRLGWQPRTTLETGLHNMIEDYK